jgi:RNA polymerase sigma-70 factor, ECF subfamily
MEAPGNGRYRPGDSMAGGTAGLTVTPPAVLRLSSSPSRQEAQPSQQDRQTTARVSAAPPLDAAGVEAAKRGDPVAWESAYLVYGRALMGYLMMRLENRDDAAEALSETFARAIDKASSFRGDAYAFRAWLFTIARNVSTDQQRLRARLVVIPEMPDTDDRPQASGDDLAILAEDVAEIRRGFARLPQADQEILWLRVCSGLSAADVGKVLDKKAGAVRMQQMRALESLRGQMTL